MTAHQQDDQAETLLLRLTRGAGVRGLAAMLLSTTFAEGIHLRPLLPFTRQELLAYAQTQQLQWLEDESNLDTRYTRNFFRHTVLPLFQQRWPAIQTILARTAEHCAEATTLLDELAAQDLRTCQKVGPHIASVDALLNLSKLRCKNVIRHWCQRLNISVPNTRQLEHILQDVLLSKQTRCPAIRWSNVVLRRYQDQLYLTKYVTAPKLTDHYIWDFQQCLIIPGIGILKAQHTRAGQGISLHKIRDKRLIVRFRQWGERCHPLGRTHSQSLKKLMQAWQIPPWERARTPLLYADDQLIAVIGYCVCANFGADATETGWLPQLIKAIHADS